MKYVYQQTCSQPCRSFGLRCVWLLQLKSLSARCMLHKLGRQRIACSADMELCCSAWIVVFAAIQLILAQVRHSGLVEHLLTRIDISQFLAEGQCSHSALSKALAGLASSARCAVRCLPLAYDLHLSPALSCHSLMPQADGRLLSLNNKTLHRFPTSIRSASSACWLLS